MNNYSLTKAFAFSNILSKIKGDFNSAIYRYFDHLAGLRFSTCRKLLQEIMIFFRTFLLVFILIKKELCVIFCATEIPSWKCIHGFCSNNMHIVKRKTYFLKLILNVYEYVCTHDRAAFIHIFSDHAH